MNAGVSLVRAYLLLNGYFTATDIPVIRQGAKGGYLELTDIDVMGVRFPFAAHVVPMGEPGPHDDLSLPIDPKLEIDESVVDIIVAEVKEGRPQLNAMFRTDDALERALARLGCVPPARTEEVVKMLRESGVARLEGEGLPATCRIRLMAFGAGQTGPREGYSVVSLRGAARFVARNLRDYHHVIRPARINDPFMGILHFLEKISP
jgi:hypothetical protein